jgi:hypothetical protein
MSSWIMTNSNSMLPNDWNYCTSCFPQRTFLRSLSIRPIPLSPSPKLMRAANCPYGRFSGALKL